MADNNVPAQDGQKQATPDFRSLVKEVLGEFMEMQKNKAEPAYKAELDEERRKREHLERKLNDLVEENHKARQRAEEAERTTAIRNELQKLGVAKVDLAFRAVKDEIARTEDGRLIARDGSGELDAREFLQKFVQDNPELLPPRITGGSGVTLGHKTPSGSVDLDRIRPGMDPEELERVRKEIARIASQSVKGM